MMSRNFRIGSSIGAARAAGMARLDMGTGFERTNIRKKCVGAVKIALFGRIEDRCAPAEEAAAGRGRQRLYAAACGSRIAFVRGGLRFAGGGGCMRQACGSRIAFVRGKLRFAGGGGCMRRGSIRGSWVSVVRGGLAARGRLRLYAAGFGLRTTALGRLAGGSGSRVVRRDDDPRPCFRGARRRRFVGILRINLFLPAAFRIFDKSFRGRSRSVARGSALRRTGGRRSEMV